VTEPIRWQTATVTEIIVRTSRIKSFFLTLSQPFAFQAGQHVDVRLTAPDGYRAMRSYSIASSPEDSTHIELAVELLENGEVSPFFHDVVAVGDAIELRGPLGGYFLWPSTLTTPLLLAGGGSGVVPLMSMIRHRHATGDRVPTVLLYSARSWDETLYRDELLELDGRNDGFRVAFTLTRDNPRRPGDYARRVDPAMMTDVLNRFSGPSNDAFVCGSNAFVDAAGDAAVAAGVPADNVRTERYGV
jgi:ferredoxin-NADP reductase